MKNLIKLLPAALGLFALVSCNSDEFGTEGQVDLTGKAVLEITDGDAETTRSFKTSEMATQYEVGDAFRVYDNLLQAYYQFDYATDGSKFVYNGSEDLTDFNASYVLYGVKDENISYAGWKNGKNIALLKVESEYDYSENEGTTVGYKSILPMLGKVTSVDQTGEKPWLKARTFTLVARAKVTFKNGAGTKVKRVRARALKFNSGKNINDYGNLGFEKNDVTVTAKSGSVYDNLLEATEPVVTDIDAPKLNGWFEAVLDKDVTGKTTEGGLQACEGIVDNSTATNEIVVTIDPSDMKDYTNCVFFPIAPGNYDLIVFEYSTLDADATTDGAENWQYIGYATGNIDRTWKMGDFEGENKASNDLTIETALKINANYIQNCEAVSKVMADNTIKEAPVVINLNPNTSTEYVKTINSNVESQYTIYIPQLKNDMTVNFKTKTILNKKLVIKDVAGANNEDFTIKFNFNSFDNSKYDDIEISTTAKELKLEGDYSKLTAAKAVKVLDNSNVTVVSEDGKTSILNLTNEGTGTIAVDGDATNTLAITTLNAGKANKVKVAGYATKTTITTLNNDECDDVEVGGGTVTYLVLDKAATITVNGDGIVENIKAGQDIESDIAITVNSADNGIIKSFAEQIATPSKSGKYVYTLSSKFTDKTTVNSAAQPSTYEIYTAAQLNSIAGWSNAAKLKTAIEIESGTWTSPDLKVPFDGDNKAITKLNAPLFGKIQTGATTIEKLNISDANITATAAKAGILAKEAVAKSSAATIAIKNSTIAGTINSEYNFVGGLIGVVNAQAGAVTVTFGTDGAAANATATLTTDITLNNTKTYSAVEDILDVNAGTWGEYIGSVVNAGTNDAAVTVFHDCASANVPTAATLKYNWKRSAKFEAGKVVVKGYLTDTNMDGSKTDHHWIGFVGTATDAIKVVKPKDLTKITLKYPMTVNGVNSLVTFPNTTAEAYGTDGTKYTFVIDGLDDADVTYASLNDKSGKKTDSGTPKTAVIYHNAYTGIAY